MSMKLLSVDVMRYVIPAFVTGVLTSACIAQGDGLDTRGEEAAAFEPIELTDAAALPEIEVDRTTDQLRDVIRPVPDPDSTNTALVFNNPRRFDTWVYCVAYDGNGQPVGRARLRVPGNGVRFVFASDMADGRDFVGSAACASRSRVIPSAFIVGGGLTDARAVVNHGWDHTRIRFPVVATF